MQSNPRISVNLLVILVKILVNLLVILVKNTGKFNSKTNQMRLGGVPSGLLGLQGTDSPIV